MPGLFGFCSRGEERSRNMYQERCSDPGYHLAFCPALKKKNSFSAHTHGAQRDFINDLQDKTNTMWSSSFCQLANMQTSLLPIWRCSAGSHFQGGEGVTGSQIAIHWACERSAAGERLL